MKISDKCVDCKYCLDEDGGLDGKDIFKIVDSKRVYEYTICENCIENRLVEDYAKDGIIWGRILEHVGMRKYYRDEIDMGRNLLSNLRFVARLKYINPLTEAEKKLMSEQEALQFATEKFERQVWFDGGLQKFIRETNGTQVCNLENYTVLVATGIGRAEVTLQSPNESYFIRLLCDETSKSHSMGFRSLSCTIDQGIYLIENAISDWKADKIKLQNYVY